MTTADKMEKNYCLALLRAGNAVLIQLQKNKVVLPLCDKGAKKVNRINSIIKQ
jgi:hypothetical protein